MWCSMSTEPAIKKLFEKIRHWWNAIAQAENVDKVAIQMCLQNTSLADDPELVATCTSQNAYLEYFFKQARALQQEHLVAKAAHDETTFTCVVTETSDHVGGGVLVRMAVKDHRLTVKAYDYLIVEDAGEAWRVQVHETSRQSPESLRRQYPYCTYMTISTCSGTRRSE